MSTPTPPEPEFDEDDLNAQVADAAYELARLLSVFREAFAQRGFDEDDCTRLAVMAVRGDLAPARLRNATSEPRKGLWR